MTRKRRSKTLSMQRLQKLPILEGATDHARPKTRAECLHGPRPCPYVGCRHHLYLEVHAKRGSITFNFPQVDADNLEAMPATCALDIADKGGAKLEDLAPFFNLSSRERVRQMVDIAVLKMRALLAEEGEEVSEEFWNKSDDDED